MLSHFSVVHRIHLKQPTGKDDMEETKPRPPRSPTAGFRACSENSSTWGAQKTPGVEEAGRGPTGGIRVAGHTGRSGAGAGSIDPPNPNANSSPGLGGMGDRVAAPLGVFLLLKSFYELKRTWRGKLFFKSLTMLNAQLEDITKRTSNQPHPD